MRKAHKTILLTLAAAAASVATCHGHDPLPPEVDEVVNSCEDVAQGQAFASDESFTKFVEAEAAGRLMTEDCQAPLLTAPAPGGTVDRTTPPTITFTPTQPACARASVTPPRRGSALCRTPRRGRWDRIWETISPIGVAQAHCPAVDGSNFLLRITDAGDKLIYSALLSVTSFQPKEAAWRKAMSGRGGQTIRVRIQRAMFVRGSIMEGPFVGREPFSLTVAP
jgi:hypothetical protein